MPRIYYSKDMPKAVWELFSEYGELRPVPSYKKLPRQIDSHADILMFYGGGDLYLPAEYYNENRDLFEGVNVCTVDEEFGKEYGKHVYLDSFVLKDMLVCREKLTSERLLEKYRVINVKQGYARCSTLKLNDNAIISADEGICKRAREYGADALHISDKGIILPGYSCGFIGGASAVFGNTVVFFGDVTRHPDWMVIKEFINKYEMKIVFTPSCPLTDYGSAVMVQS